MSWLYRIQNDRGETGYVWHSNIIQAIENAPMGGRLIRVDRVAKFSGCFENGDGPHPPTGMVISFKESKGLKAG